MARITTYSDLYVQMVPELPGILNTPILMLQALQEAAREFCRKTESWQDDVIKNAVADQRAYTITPAYDARVERVLSVHELTEDDVSNDREGSLAVEDYYDFNQPNELKFIYGAAPTTAVASGLRVRIVMVPFIGTSDMDEDFLNRYATPIKGKALSELMSQERKKWTNPQRSLFWMNEYRRGIGSARSDVATKAKGVTSAMGA